MKRTHHCNQLRKADENQTVTLIGWVDSIRDHGGVFFLDLRDREGMTQILLDPEQPSLAELFHEIKPESIIEVSGTVKAREQNTINLKRDTGEIEVVAKTLILHNIAQTPPFPLEDSKTGKVQEDLRLTYRYLDLRRPSCLKRFKTRHMAAKCIRDYLDAADFIEVELPTLFKSTPEGAREFLVPSRLNQGQFYALAQSPQQYKQMLMVAGFERYYSLARCYRDEDLRSDRQPEFTQVDLEMSFIDREAIYALMEGMMQKLWHDILDTPIPTPLLRLPYKDAMNRFGTDKPDMRFGMELQDFSNTFKNSEFKVFSSALQNNGTVKAFNAKGLSDITQGELKRLEEIAKTLGAKGLAYIKAESDGWKSPILKFISEKEKNELAEKLKIENGDLVFFAATRWEEACSILGRIRLETAHLLQARNRLSISSDDYKFLWVTDFPLMAYDPETQSFQSAHHPFTAPVPEDVPLLETNPQAVRGQHYDLVLNGVELGGGSIRVHQPAVQQKIFEDVLKIPPEIVKDRFGYMLNAFKYGTPPHGGIALGFDRLAALLNGTTNIRDVIAFPKTQKGQDLMSLSPSSVPQKSLTELGITLLDI